MILALIFGASRVSDLGGALGRGIREFRQQARHEGDEEEEKDEPEKAQASSQSSSDGDRSESSG